ncbi:DNA-binding transcriptional regulator [Pseudomonas syringae pv. actinidiae]|uniref:DNA-binding transcriptional regulator n=1 Tax=Pseudomonas syringae pv. actinidiae TaxID=103796 RepID=A0A2V0QR31_PSESF|nr:DNA-binding transcriptional regulator [Pseudomonas syringae pv. actinidiae]
MLAPEKNREHSIKLQLPAWNVGFMRRLRTMELIRNRPAGHVHLCHVAPVKGNQCIGLLHYNLYYGGDYQNNIFRNSYAGGGLYIYVEDLDPAWTVGGDTPNKEVLSLVKEFLGDVLTNYIKICSVRKSKRVQIARKIMESDNQLNMDELLDLSFNELSDRYKVATRRPLYKPAKRD